MPLASHVPSRGTTVVACPPSAVSRRPPDAALAVHPISPALSAAPSSRSLPQNGPIHLNKDNFPLLHSLLQSPEYLDAVAHDPGLARRPSTRHTKVSTSTGIGSSRTQRKPSRSGASGVADLWSKVPRAFGSSSSVAGSARAARQSQKKRSTEWDVVEAGAAVETLSKAAVAAGSASAVGRAGRAPQTGEHERAARRPPPAFLLASHSLPDLPTTSTSTASAPVTYSSRPTQAQALPSNPHPPPTRPSTAFASTVSTLKRMLTRSSRPSDHSSRPRRSRSFGTKSAFSASTMFGGERRPRATSGLSGGVLPAEDRVATAAEHVWVVLTSSGDASTPAREPRRPSRGAADGRVEAGPSASSAPPPSSALPTSPRYQTPRQTSSHAVSSGAPSSKPPVSRRPPAPPGVAAFARPTSLSAFPTARPLLDRNESTSTTYASYGRRWEGSASTRAAARASRRSLSVRRKPAAAAAALADIDAGDEKVWSKWRRWVRERREAMRKQDERTDGQK
ncbi:hypothetical protein JCM3775_001571 [Rhodotorula graminis]